MAKHSSTKAVRSKTVPAIIKAHLNKIITEKKLDTKKWALNWETVYSIKCLSTNDVTAIGRRGKLFCDDNTKALVIKLVAMAGGGSKISWHHLWKIPDVIRYNNTVSPFVTCWSLVNLKTYAWYINIWKKQQATRVKYSLHCIHIYNLMFSLETKK